MDDIQWRECDCDPVPRSILRRSTINRHGRCVGSRKGRVEDRGYGKLSLTFRKRNVIVSLNKVAYVRKLRQNHMYLGAVDHAGKHSIVGGVHIIMCKTDMIKKRFGTCVGRADRIKNRDDDSIITTVVAAAILGIRQVRHSSARVTQRTIQ